MSFRDYIEKIFIYLFDIDIESSLKMEDKWKLRKKPRKLIWNELIKNNNKVDKMHDTSNYDKTKILTVNENFHLFLSTFKQLLSRTNEEEKYLYFDKDDSIIMSFVSCLSNLRMYCYNIELQSEFTNKGIAGNIIHAIATTNAICAAAMVVQAIHILRDEKMNNNKNKKIIKNFKKDLPHRNSWIKINGPRYLYAQGLESQRSDCFICNKSQLNILLECDKWKFNDFLNKILMKHLSFLKPQIIINSNNFGKGFIDIINSKDLDDVKNDADEYSELMDEYKCQCELFDKYLCDSSIKMDNQSELIINDELSNLTKIKIMIHDLPKKYKKWNTDKYPKNFIVFEKKIQLQEILKNDFQEQEQQEDTENQNEKENEKEKESKQNVEIESNGHVTVTGKKRNFQNENNNERNDDNQDDDDDKPPPKKKQRISKK